MGRGKLSMKLISNEKSRRTTFCKRKKSLMRKAYELSTLCDVRACVFVFGPNLHNDQSPLEVHTWPPCRDDINDMIASYKANCLHKRARKAFGLLDFFSERRKKIECDMSKIRKDVVEVRFPKWDERLDYLLEDQLRLLIVELDSKLDATKRRIEVLTENHEDVGMLAGSSQQALNANMKQKQVMSLEEQSYNMFGSSTSMETQAIIPFHHQYHQIQTMAQNLQMGSLVVPIENFSQYLFGSNNGSSSQIQFNYGNCFPNPNFDGEPTNGMIMDNHPHELENFSQYLFGSNNNGSSTQIQLNCGNCFQNPNFDCEATNGTQNYSMCHYGVPQSIMPLSYMQLTDDRVMMACASNNSQMVLPNNASAQLSDQLDYFNYEYFMKTNNV